MFARLFRRSPEHAHLPQSDDEGSDNDTLLPNSSDLPKIKHFTRTKSEYQVALRTLIICSIVYLSAGLWIVHSVRSAEFVIDADDFCIHHVSRYCTCPFRNLG